MIVLRHLGDIARQRGEIEEARSWYSRALDGDPQDTEVAAYLAELTEPLVVTEPGGSSASVPEPEMAIAEMPVAQPEEVPTESPAEQPVEEIAEAAVGEPVAQVADTSFDTTFEELIVDEGVSEPVMERTPLRDDSPYLDDSESIFDEPILEASQPGAQTSPSEEPAVAETPSAYERDEEAPVEEDAPPPEPPADDRSYRSTPAYEGSPIITRTLAELYLEQGYIEPALEIYRQLAEREPHDVTLQARISEISTDAQEEAAATTRDESPAVVPESAEEPSFEAETSREPAEKEEREAQATESEPLTDIWDAPDSWGADMFEDVDEGAEIFGMTATSLEETQPARSDSAEASLEEESLEEEWLEEPALDQQPVLEAEVDIDEEPPKTLAEAIAQADAEIQSEPEIEPVSAEEPVGAEEEPVRAEEEPVRAEEEPVRGITIREFFATLGSARPPTANGEDAFTREEEEAPREPQPSDEQQYPYADDAFASLFQDALVSPEDSRAAAALSSAVAHKPPSPGVATPPDSQPARQADESGPPEQAMQESEDDIRRFREWLDGLASS
jgi:tetratricopeptide (TPR) repeat protein